QKPPRSGMGPVARPEQLRPRRDQVVDPLHVVRRGVDAAAGEVRLLAGILHRAAEGIGLPVTAHPAVVAALRGYEARHPSGLNVPRAPTVACGAPPSGPVTTKGEGFRARGSYSKEEGRLTRGTTMADTLLSTAVRGIRQLVTAPDVKDRSDGQL